MAAIPPICDFGWKAPGFTLPGTDGKTYSMQDVMGPKGAVILFMSNHCPYVRAIIDRIIREAKALADHGIGFAAICSNDPVSHPGDSFENMKAWAEALSFPFPYLHDADQSVARDWDAICTPDFFGLDADGGLQYRGRLDASGKQPAAPDTRRELYEAMVMVAETGHGPKDQLSSMGCSIKWKAA